MTRLADLEFPPDLLERAGRGELVAQERLYRLLSPAVFALIRRLVGDRETAEDLFQDSLMRVLEHLPAFRGEAPFGIWVRRIAVSRCLMHLRSPWQRARTALDEFGIEAATESWQLRDGTRPGTDGGDRIDLDRALARLKPTARTVLWLHDVEGYTHEEIARGFGRTTSFSKSQLARAHEALRPMLGATTETLACRNLEPLAPAARSPT